MLDCIPSRFVVAFMMFTGCAISYMLRVNISINIIAMVDDTGTSNKTSIPECIATNPERLQHYIIETSSAEDFNDNSSSSPNLPDFGVRYDWDSTTQGIILGAYFWGSIVSCFVGGLIAEKFGPSRTVTVSTIIAAVLTILTPLVASWPYGALVTCRAIIGLTGGVVYPSMHCLISRWSPPDEKGKFVFSLLGGALGTILTWALLGPIIETWGWVWAFYSTGGLALVWSLAWYFFVTDTPDEHKRISIEEKKFIANSLEGMAKPQKGLPPYKSIILSVPMWAFIILHFGSNWGLFFLMTAGPKFVSTVLGFNLSNSGILSALPYLARMTFGFFFGFAGDLVIKKKWLGRTAARNAFVICSHTIPGIFLIIMSQVGCAVTWSIAVITFSLGMNGASSVTNLMNAQDLSPTYAGTLYGIANSIGVTTGFITPYITGYITQKHNGMDEWKIIFYIGASVYIAGGVVFWFFGSGETQPFNFEGEVDKTKEDKSGVDNKAYEKDQNNDAPKEVNQKNNASKEVTQNNDAPKEVTQNNDAPKEVYTVTKI